MMKSLKELFRIGNGPSSSHTIGPKNCCLEFIKRNPNCDKIDVILYGSLALTGIGHSTDRIIKDTLSNYNVNVKTNILDNNIPHPNTLDIIGYKNGNIISNMRFLSIGGGAIEIYGEENKCEDIYKLSKLSDIICYCKKNNLRLYQYVDLCEGSDFNSFMEEVYKTMMESIDRGLNKKGILPGPLKLERKANYLYNNAHSNLDVSQDLRRKAISYAYAVSEENASGGVIVTAPTCGASGVLPAVMKTAIEALPLLKNNVVEFDHQDVLNALKTAGLIGNLIKTNGSISGAEAGCQAEIGSACAMASAFQAELAKTSLEEIARASEIALEHHLGLTCDPIGGYVQIPCIERNAIATLRALDAFGLSYYLDTLDSRISFDTVVETMLETGKDLSSRYRETSSGGLAVKYKC